MDEGLRRMRMAACKSIKCAYFSSEIIYPSSQQDQNIVKKERYSIFCKMEDAAEEKEIFTCKWYSLKFLFLR
jgi:hypothetical protein